MHQWQNEPSVRRTRVRPTGGHTESIANRTCIPRGLLVRDQLKETCLSRSSFARLGKIRQPQYRIVVADSRTRRKRPRHPRPSAELPPPGRPLFIGTPDRAQYWLGVGAAH